MRKSPKQKRSREMVSRLLTATADTIVEIGLENTTTNHIARRANVSVGSLYQYFPDKQTLIDEMLEHVATRMLVSIQKTIMSTEADNYTLRDATYEAISHVYHFIKQQPLSQELIQHKEIIDFSRITEPLSEYFMELARSYFLRNFREYPVQNLNAKLYVLINSTILVAAQYLKQEVPPMKEQDFFNSLTDMFVALIQTEQQHTFSHQWNL